MSKDKAILDGLVPDHAIPAAVKERLLSGEKVVKVARIHIGIF